jgi:hypothetical protein
MEQLGWFPAADTVTRVTVWWLGPSGPTYHNGAPET